MNPRRVLCCYALAFSFIFFIVPMQTVAQLWQPLGPDDFNNASMDNCITPPTMAVSPDGVPYVFAGEEVFYSYRGTLRRFNNGKWENVGPRASTTGMLYSVNMTFDTAGNYYTLLNTAGGASLKKTTPSGITTSLGISGIPSTAYLTTSLSGELYAAFNEGPSFACFVSLKKYNGTAFVDVGMPASISPAGPAPASTIPIVRIGRNGKPYVAYRQSSSGSVVVVKRFDGVSWVQLGTNNVSGGNIDNLDMALDTADNPVVIYKDNANHTQVAGYSFASDTWTTISTPAITGGTCIAQHIVIGKNNVPVIMYYDQSVGKLVTMRYSVGTWADMNSNQSFKMISKPISWYGFAIDKFDVPYLFYSNQKCGVMKYNGTIWTDIGTPGFSGAQAPEIALAVSNRGSTYVAYQDLLKNAQITVRHYINGQWQIIGELGEQLGICRGIQMKCDTAGMPIVAYLDNYNPGTDLAVKRYNGTSWVNLANVPVGPPREQIAMTLDKDGTPYIAYHIGTPAPIIAIKYTGNGWDTIGHAPAFSGYGKYPSIAVDNNYNPYVAYQDWDGQGTYRPYVVKLVNGSWAQVGGSVHNSRADNLKLAISPGNIPYLGYVDFGANQRGGVKRFNGSSWSNAGTNWAADYPTLHLNLEIAANGYTYVSYRGDTGRVFVKRLQGNSWVQPGFPDAVSAGGCTTSALAVDSNGYVSIAYDNFNLFVKKYNDCLSGPRLVVPACAGGQIQLSSNQGSSYNWSGPGGFASTQQSPAIPVTTAALQNGYYSVTVSFANGCIHKDSIEINIGSLPPNTAPVVSPSSICTGDSATITATVGYNYQWYKNGNLISSTNQSSYQATSMGNYQVMLIGNDGCKRLSDTAMLIVHPLPSPVINSNGSILYTGNYTAYQWYKNGVIIPGATVDSTLATLTDTFTVSVLDTNGCSGVSAPFIYQWNSNVWSPSKNNITVGPNPVVNTLHINSPTLIKAVLFNIYNVRVGESTGEQLSIDMSVLPGGMYLLAIYKPSGEIVQTGKIVKLTGQ